MRGKWIVGNWKMNGLAADVAEARGVAHALEAQNADQVTAVICPPATLLATLSRELGNCALLLGGQDCHAVTHGAHTGDVSAIMLRDAGASLVIVGHSERRQDHGETSAVVQAKAASAIAAGLIAIICVGETQAQRDAGAHLDVVLTQLRDSVPMAARPDQYAIAYEPVWAIGTGRTPVSHEIVEVHSAIAAHLATRDASHPAQSPPILYGGSVNPANAAEILALPHVGGALVGGASLKAASFLAIIAACAG
jgi:triosephosphate isomerase